MGIERLHETRQRRTQSPSRPTWRKEFDILFSRPRSKLGAATILKEAGNPKGRKMLTQICCLFERESSIGLYNQAIETFLEKRLHRFRQTAHDVRFQVADLVQNGEGPVLEDGIGIYD